MKRSRKPHSKTPSVATKPSIQFEALEPRVLFSATLADTIESTEAPAGGAAIAQEEALAYEAATPVLASEHETEGGAILAELNRHAADLEAESRVELVFVSTDVEGYEELVAHLDPRYEVHLLDAASDGVAQIAKLLEGREGIDAIHLVAHGESGRLFLGGTVLDAGTMEGEHRAALEAIGRALAPDADILLYGCHFAEGETGAEAVALLASLTGADVAASDNYTGHAELGGDWILEHQHGAIEAAALYGGGWQGLLAPAVISAGSSSLQTFNAAGDSVAISTQFSTDGARGVWVGAGAVGDQTVDLVATIVSISGGTVRFENPASGTDDPAILLTRQSEFLTVTAVIEWKIVLTGTDIAATGDITFSVGDIDGIGGNPSTRETVTPSLNGLTAYGANDPTNISFAISDGLLQASGTQDQNNEPESVAFFTWQNVSSWEITYQLHANSVTQARFTHDGDGDFVFSNLETVPLLEIDLDDNDSTAPGTGYRTLYNEGGPAVGIAAADASILQNLALGGQLGGATVVLTNAQSGDQLLVAGSSDSSGTISGVDYAIAEAGGSIAITFTGVADLATYEAILKSITYQNTQAGFPGGDRIVEVDVTNTAFGTTSNTAIATIEVNRAPLANHDSSSTVLNTPVVVDLLANDSDPEGDDFSLVGTPTVGDPAHGSLEFTGGNWVFTPAAGFGGTATIHYTVQDARGALSTGTHSVVVANAEPTLVDPDPTPGSPFIDPDDPTRLVLPATDNLPFSLALADYFDDPNGDPLDIVPDLTGLPWLSYDPVSQILSGTPPVANAGLVVVPFTVSDGNGGLFSGTIAIVPVNPAPVAEDDDFDANEDDGPLVVGNALDNDSDPDGDALAAVPQSGVAGDNGGLFSIDASGEVTFDPNGDFENLAAGATRQTSFTYTLVDADGATSTATVTVTVTGVNDAPFTVGTIGNRSNNDGDEVAPFSVAGFFGDPDVGDVLTFTATGLPAGLTLDENTGEISGTLGTSASAGSPHTVEITANDGQGGSVTQTFTWNVANLPPVAEDDAFGANEKDPAAIVGNALDNDGDPDGDALTAVPQSGVAGDNGGLFSIDANGNVTFDPNGAFTDLALGETRDTSFTYTLVDADGATSTATVTVTVTGQNDAPVAVGTIATQGSNDSDPVSLNVSGFFADPDGSDALTFGAAGLPPGLSIHPGTGLISGTLDSSASAGGPYSVAITATDPHGASVTQTFTWNVANLPPVAEDDAFGANEKDPAAIVGNALDNDGDPDGDALTAVPQSGVAGDNGGLFSIDANGDVTFDPNGAFTDLAPGETRETSFTYTLVDADGATSTATVTVTVTGQNDAPVAVGTIATQGSNDSDPVSLNVSGFFADPDGSDALTFGAAGLPPGLSIHPVTGLISGTLDSSASAGGPYSVAITATDPHGASVTQTFTWNVANLPPVAEDDAFGANEKDPAAIVGNALDNDSDPDGDALTAVPLSGVLGSHGGLFSINAAGNVTFDPNGDFEDLALGQSRATSFTYTLVDADGASATATVTVTVAGANDAPFAIGVIDDRAADDSDAVSLDLSGFFGDPDNGAVLTFSAADLPTGLSIDPVTGVVSGTIDSSASVGGPYEVKVTATDEHGASLTRCFVWTVANPAPVAEDDAFEMRQDRGAIVVGNALTNDRDPDGDALRALPEKGVAGTGGGQFSIDEAGNVIFDPGSDFRELRTGQSRRTSFTYTLVDADGATATATVTVTVLGTNDPPKVGSGRLVVSAGSSGDSLGLKAPVDPDGDRLTIRVTSLPRTGVLRLANGKEVKLGQKLSARQFEGLVYDAPFFHPGKGPILFRYSVSDGQYAVKGRVAIRVQTQPYFVCHPEFSAHRPAKTKTAASHPTSPKSLVHGLPTLSKALAQRALEVHRR